MLLFTYKSAKTSGNPPQVGWATRAAKSRYGETMTVTLEIPDSVLQGLRLPEDNIPQRLRTELAIALYSQEVLSLGKAAELAELSRLTFGKLLGQRGIARHYNEDDLARDTSYALGKRHSSEYCPV